MKIFKQKIKKAITSFFYYIEYFFLKLFGETDEIIVVIDGGLGSQMSQYLLGYEIHRITKSIVSYDLSWYENNNKDIKGIENRKYILEAVFKNIELKKASKKKIKLYKQLFNRQNNKLLIQNLDSINLLSLPIYLGGYWKTDIYSNYDIEDTRLKFTFNLSLDDKNKKMLNLILNNNCSVSIQLRFGDYIGSVLDIITPNYFYNAIKYIENAFLNSNLHFFIFSNDIEKSKLYLKYLYNRFTFIDINDNDSGAYDMFLMSQCHHFIISNSSFGFWPALLSNRCENKIVIQPDKWINTESKKLKPKYPGWIMLEC